MGDAAWSPLGEVAPSALGEARAELHWAASAVEQVGKALVEPVEDFSHIALRWSGEQRALLTAPTANGTRAGLRLADGELLALGPGGEVSATWELADGTLDGAAAWVRKRCGELAGAADPEWKPLRRDGLPRAGVAEGDTFSVAGNAYRELAAWYGNAAGVLERSRADHAEAGPVLCWPHHFDIATRLDFDPDADPEKARSVGLGFSPGDESSPEPYFYILPWPRPDVGELPPFRGLGGWVSEDWVGGFLAGSDVVELDAIARESAVAMFLREGLAAAKGALDL